MNEPILQKPFWWDSKLECSSSIHAIPIGAQSTLFCTRTQRLFDLNPTAAFIWRGMGEGLSCKSIAQELQQAGAPPAQSAIFAVTILGDWMRSGYVTPSEILRDLRGPAGALRRLTIGHLAAELRFLGDADPRPADAVFGHFQGGEDEPSLRAGIVSRAGFDFLFRGETPIGMNTPSETIPAVKALLTDAYCNGLIDGFIAHGALVTRNGKRVLLTGPPGAGKTTLTLALAAADFSYAGDDIVRISQTGQAEGASFSAAVKSGAWDVLGPYVPGLGSLPVFERADGQLVRYVLPERLDLDGERPIDVILLLARDQEAEARLTRLAPLDALRALLESGYSRQAVLDAATLKALAAHLSGSPCYRLAYGDLPNAVAAIAGLT